MKCNVKRIGAFTMAAVLGLATLTGCASGTANDTAGGNQTAENQATENQAAEGEKIVIDFQNFSAAGGNEETLEKMIDLYEKENPNVEIKLQTLPFNGYTDQMMAKVAGGQAPDVYELSTNNFASFAGKGVLYDMEPMIESSNLDMSVYNQRALSAYEFEGKQYGIPNSFSNVMLFYNKDLFDQAGVDYPTPDWTWTDALEAAKKIRALDENTFGYFRPVTYNELFKVAEQNGGSIMNEDQTAFTMNTPEVIEAAEYMSDMVTEYNVMPTEAQLGGMGDWDLFKSGRLGMLLTGIWAFPNFAENCTFNWDVEVEPGNKEKATHFFSNAYVIDKNSDVAETAMDFVQFMTSSPDVANIRVEVGWELPPITNEEVTSKYTSQTPPENRTAVFDSLEYLVVPPVVEQQALVEDIVNQHLQSVVTGASTVEEAMEACQKELEEQISLK